MARARDLIDGETETGGFPRLHPGLLGEPQAEDGRLPQTPRMLPAEQQLMLSSGFHVPPHTCASEHTHIHTNKAIYFQTRHLEK